MSEEIQKPKEHPEGWVQIPIRRGLFEIRKLLDLRDILGGRFMGGFARYCCSERETPKEAMDIDIFPIAESPLSSNDVFEGWKSELAAAGLKIKHENEISITYERAESGPLMAAPVVQLIKPTSEGAIVTEGTVEEVLNAFDFTVVRVALNPDRETATAWASFVEDDKSGLIRILNIHCPVSSLLRVCKYSRKGYYCRPAEALKLFIDWQNRGDEYRSKLVELFQKGTLGEITQEEVDQLESLLNVD